MIIAQTLSGILIFILFFLSEIFKKKKKNCMPSRVGGACKQLNSPFKVGSYLATCGTVFYYFVGLFSFKIRVKDRHKNVLRLQSF